MGKKTGVFSEGQLVYAKVKGYSPWPAKITKVIGKHKYGVYFYGTGETGNCKSEELDPYDEKNRQRFNTDRQLKKPDYNIAVKQIESALAGNDPAPIISSIAGTINDEDNESVVMESAENSTMKVEDASQDATDFDPEESQLQIAEDIPKSTPAQKKKPAAKPVPVVHTPTTNAESIKHEAKENDEKVSRSGRKIKEKKINNDEMDPDEVFTQSRKRFKAEDSNRSRNSTTAPNDSAINDFATSKMHILQDPVRKQFLNTQFEMIQLIQDIKQSLGLEMVEVDRALTACTTLKEKVLPRITQLMLLKYSYVVVTIKRLRNYIGNLEVWKMEEEPQKKFEEKAQQIRNIACEIYDSFRKLFPEAPQNSPFFDYFVSEQTKFSEKYGKIDLTELFEARNFEEMDAFLNKKSTSEETSIPNLQEDSSHPITAAS